MSNPFSSQKNSVNIGGNSGDVFHRYKMPSIKTTYKNKNGGTTIITNLDAICKSLHRTSSQLDKYYSKKLSSAVRTVSGEGMLIVGEHTTNKLQDILSQYVNEMVLCQSCKSPETEIVQKKNTYMICRGCSYEHQLKN